MLTAMLIFPEFYRALRQLLDRRCARATGLTFGNEVFRFYCLSELTDTKKGKAMLVTGRGGL
jgi:hypothetical protein